MSYFGMSKLAMKWALTKPPTTRYPFEPRNPIAGSRGQLIFTKDNCVYCNVCAKRTSSNNSHHLSYQSAAAGGAIYG